MSAENTQRPAEPVAAGDPRITALRRLLGIVDRLRDPDGCPWDLEQTEESMAPSLVEEAFECQEAIESGDANEIAEEVGDVLLNVALICRIGGQAGRFDLAQAAEAVSEKLVRRHPHVFGATVVASTGEVLSNWEAIKKEERRGKSQDDSAMAGVPKALPALQRAARMCEKAVTVGFRWQDVRGAFLKIEEELGELREVLPEDALAADSAPEFTDDVRARVEAELGDLLIASAFFGQYAGLDPERLCRDALRRFEARFRHLEAGLDGKIAGHSLEELQIAWESAKNATE
jgi:MazG family protein